MPKSRNRKDHKKKVQQRNAQMNQLEKTYQKMYNQKMIEHLKALHEEHIKTSGTTENDGPIQPTDNTEL
jgi:hypothetical protein